ncbi:AAA family ATPase [Streptomyces sp. NPDC047046]|uniref:AAA family ATPase n=1 Tax=Streptomyces sp. NPDC047046 TaxID=3155378 RepID=UPI0033DCD702
MTTQARADEGGNASDDFGDDVPFVLVAGYAGSGKSEAGKLLASVTGWALIDKDTLTRPFVEALLRAHGVDPDDRQSPFYLEQVRPLEYDCLLKTCWENLEHGIPVVAVAPFLREVTDPRWNDRTRRHAARLGAATEVLWVDSDHTSMRERLTSRNASRDTWKLANWREYVRTVVVSSRPEGPYEAVDNRVSAGTPLAEQIEAVAERLLARHGQVAA